MTATKTAAELAAQVKDRMTVTEAAGHLGLATQTLNKMRSEGRGPRYMKLGSRVFYRRADLEAYLQACTVETADSREVA